MMTDGLKQAIEKAGGQSALADLLGIRQSVVANWLHRQHRVPAERVIPIERATGVRREALRPDLYPVD